MAKANEGWGNHLEEMFPKKVTDATIGHVKAMQKADVIPMRKDEAPSAPDSQEEPTTEQIKDATLTPSDRLRVSPSDGYTLTPLDRLMVTPSHPQTVSGSHPETHHQTPPQNVPLEVLNLSYNQAHVLEDLIGNPAHRTTAKTISNNTRVTVPSVREAIKMLTKKAFMLPPETIREPGGGFQGFSYVLNKRLCDYFIELGGTNQNHYTHPHTLTPSDGLMVHSSSKVLNLSKNLTTLDPQTVSGCEGVTVSRSDPQTPTPSNGGAEFILIGLLGDFWLNEGLTEGQAQGWLSEFSIDRGMLRLALEWGWYELEYAGGRAKVESSSTGRFYRTLVRTKGRGSRPPGFRTIEEIELEVYLEDERRRKEAKEKLLEIKFELILKDPKSDEYQTLYNQLEPGMTNGPFASTPDVIERAMKALFFAKNGIPVEE